MRITKSLLAVAAGSLILSSCVSSKVHQELQDKYDALAAANENLLQENEECSADLTEARALLDRCVDARDELIQDTVNQNMAIRKLRRSYEDLNKNYEFLLDNNNTMLANNARENRALLDRLEALQDQLEDKEDSLRIEQESLSTLRSMLEAREARVNELEGVIARQDSIVNYVQQRVSDALLGFEGKGLTVEMKNGQVYVSLENRLLFASGSWTVQQEGQNALNQLASVLADNPDIKIMVEGHTDDDAYRGNGQVRDNWDLSVMRSTSVVKILLNNEGIAPQRITAAGRGEYLPLASNETAEGKAKNRRIEVILTPDLSELMELVGSMK
ncbi:MAG: cell envelope biogenesis protein OmpA [Bacteroidetes bacterium]|uniref:OmpA family protein n=1 Tax=Phaeocystidibacter marisrubri TaxID=1577780 RepID=A0A6L3ZF04_9FLAO|nr:OmpA family protein [Phaeocystidibacter marisrubri]KAB2816178.1 OmpA family protein [Phaeocystidibacter marisrubri]TNE26323.1 MAG: cell envelope biogenesis protein OmpA [Bacteroidota bacterium]GGH67712.1 cell envelope biogenesis protein OmpA [Phaeocystidibacter marisrubri]